VFILIYFKQEESWYLKGDISAIYTNPFFIQWEHGLMISPFREIEIISSV
jgi:hypothetical protein